MYNYTQNTVVPFKMTSIKEVTGIGLPNGMIQVFGAMKTASLHPNRFIEVMKRPGQQSIQLFDEEQNCFVKIKFNDRAMRLIREQMSIQFGFFLLAELAEEQVA